MTETEDWEIRAGLQPKPDDVDFDLDAALASVVALRTEVPEDAFTASTLGTERLGNGVVIGDDGLVLTIGYLITEAETIWLSTVTGRAAPAHLVAYDQATGFGLVQALSRLGVPTLPRGSSSLAEVGDPIVVAGHGGRRRSLLGQLAGKREFAGHWEYVLEEALYTTPPHPQWGGAALVGRDGRLLGIGSLLVQEALDGEPIQGNMFVPIDLLEPILEDMLRFGAPARPPRPWLGMYTAEAEQRLVVSGLAKGAPADSAGVRLGDIVIEVAGERVSGLADMFRKVWRLGPAGVEVPLTLARDSELTRLSVRSADRGDFLKKPPLQ